MTGLDALMWRLGRSGPAFSPTMTLAVALARPIGIDALIGRLEHLCAAVPKLTCRPEPAAGPVPPVWAPAPGFAVARHVGLASGPADRLVADRLRQPFPAGMAPWAVVVGSDEAVVVFHLHHSYTDGLGGLALLDGLMDGPGQPGERGGSGPAPAGGSEPPGRSAPAAPAGGLAADLVWEARHHAGVLARALPWAARTLVAGATRPESVLASAGEVGAALAGHLRAASAPPSPLLRPRSNGVAVAAIEVDLSRVRAAASAIGVTVNDVYLAGLLDGLARYHDKRGSWAPGLRLGLPVSTRRAGDELMRNQLLAAAVRGPLGRLDFVERARLVHELVLAARHQPWAGIADDGVELACRLPGAARLAATAAASFDVVASNVAGPATPLRLAGIPVTAMTPFGPRSGAAVNATLLSYSTAASIGFNLDPAAVPDPGVLADCVTAAFDEGLARA